MRELADSEEMDSLNKEMQKSLVSGKWEENRGRTNG